MPSKRPDPAVAVLRYFQEADLPLARQALGLATAIVRTREPVGKPAAKKPAKKTTTLAAVGGNE